MQEISEFFQKCISENRVKDFEKYIFDLIEKDSDNWIFNFYAGTYYLQAKEDVKAIAYLEKSTRLKPDESANYVNLGTAFRRINNLKKARLNFNKAAELHPEDPDIWANMAAIHVNNGDSKSCIEYANKALRLDPLNACARWNRALGYLEEENYELGFQEYSWGLAGMDRPIKNYQLPFWDGEPGGSIIVWGEQGVGDEIMWASMVNELVPMFDKVYLDCHPRLESLFKLSFPDCEVHPTRKEMSGANAWWEGRGIRCQIPIADLPRFLRKKESDFPKQAYLHADPDLVAEYREWIRIAGITLGVSWTGGIKETMAEYRSVSLDMLKPILEGNVSASLQYNDTNKQVTPFRESTGIQLFDFPEVFEDTRFDSYKIVDSVGDTCAIFKKKPDAKNFAATFGGNVVHVTGPAFDYMQTAAFIKALYLEGCPIVTVNTTIVHLCGALGITCHVLTPNKCAWRYGKNREDMVWYGPWVKQYRQSKDGKWPIERIAKAIFKQKRKAA